MSVLSAQIDQRWATIVRRAPYPLLALSFALAIPLAQTVGTADRLPLLAALSVVAAAAHWWCVDHRWGKPLDDWVGQTYVISRTVFAFVLTWLNPFYSVYAFLGYLDAPVYLRPRWTWAVLLMTAVTMAGAQSGGWPPHGVGQTAGFVGLFALNAGLAGLFSAIANQETALADERTSTITELEVTNTKLSDALRANAELQEELVARAREAGVHEERERLAAEIHDTIAQGLAGIVTQLQAADESSNPHEAAEHRKRAAELARVSLHEARRSVQALGPPALEQLDLVAVLRERVREWSADSGVGADLVVTGDPAPLASAHETAVVRIVSESLANVAHHANATRATVTVSFTDVEVVVDIVDDGAGFDLAQPQSEDSVRGFGLHGMRRRAERLGGSLVVESEPGNGTAVSFRVPSVNHD